LSFFIPSVFMLFCLISLHYVNGINKVMMMMMMVNTSPKSSDPALSLCCDKQRRTTTPVAFTR